MNTSSNSIISVAPQLLLGGGNFVGFGDRSSVILSTSVSEPLSRHLSHSFFHENSISAAGGSVASCVYARKLYHNPGNSFLIVLSCSSFHALS